MTLEFIWLRLGAISQLYRNKLTNFLNLERKTLIGRSGMSILLENIDRSQSEEELFNLGSVNLLYYKGLTLSFPSHSSFYSSNYLLIFGI